jgi:hydrogenase maturation protease
MGVEDLSIENCTQHQGLSAKGQTLLVVGIGNTLRGDDGVGILLLNRLRMHFDGAIDCLAISAPDILLAERFAALKELIIIDAMLPEGQESFRMLPIYPANRMAPPKGVASHLIDWATILAMARDLFGNAPKTHMLGIVGECFEMREGLSPRCQQNAEMAFDFLVGYCLRL